MTTTTTRLDLLRAVLAAPDDDAPRLAFADWLEENGDSDRSSFIRVQCELAGIPEEPPTCHPPLARGRPERCHGAFCPFCLWKEQHHDKVTALQRRERELLEANHMEWLPDTFFGWRWASSDLSLLHPWRRGFISRLTCTAADFVTHGTGVVSTQPIMEVTICGSKTIHIMKRELHESPEQFAIRVAEWSKIAGTA